MGLASELQGSPGSSDQVTSWWCPLSLAGGDYLFDDCSSSDTTAGLLVLCGKQSPPALCLAANSLSGSCSDETEGSSWWLKEFLPPGTARGQFQRCLRDSASWQRLLTLEMGQEQHFGEGNSSEDHQLFPELSSRQEGGGKREAGKSEFFITCTVLAFFTKDHLNFLLVYNFCRKRWGF